jgi:hypothetical protein
MVHVVDLCYENFLGGKGRNQGSLNILQRTEGKEKRPSGNRGASEKLCCFVYTWEQQLCIDGMS